MVRNAQNKNIKNKIKNVIMTTFFITALVLMCAEGEGWNALMLNAIGVAILAIIAFITNAMEKNKR